MRFRRCTLRGANRLALLTAGRHRAAEKTETAKLTPSDGVAGDQFGQSVSISGDVAVIGAV